MPHNSPEQKPEISARLDELGAEPLQGSGFEDEVENGSTDPTEPESEADNA